MSISVEISDIISGLALIVSTVAIILNYQTSQKQKTLIELQTMKEKEEAILKNKANIQARYFKTGLNTTKLKVSNTGLAEARNIRLTFTEDSGVPLIKGDLDSKFPLSSLEPRSGVELLTASGLQTPAKHLIRVEWDDDFQSDNNKVITLTL